ncbi:MAG: hypothetical protein QOG33_1906 [Gaiellales bacterium]|nr:hypothetical protein [Gaiellales bacterium]
MELPIWVTVFISGFVGSWIGRAISSALVLPLILGGTSAETFASNWVLVVALGGLFQSAVTGAVLLGLLPALSQVRVGFGTAFIATLVGNLITVVGTLVLLRAAIQSSLAGGAGVGILPAFGLLSLGLTALGIFVTATMIASSQAGSSDGLSLYGGQTYLDEIRKDHKP